MASTRPESEAPRVPRGREETTKVALETVAEGGPLAGDGEVKWVRNLRRSDLDEVDGRERAER